MSSKENGDKLHTSFQRDLIVFDVPDHIANKVSVEYSATLSNDGVRCAESDFWQKSPKATISQNLIIIHLLVRLSNLLLLSFDLILHDFLELINGLKSLIFLFFRHTFVHIFNVLNIDLAVLGIHSVHDWMRVSIGVSRDEVRKLVGPGENGPGELLKVVEVLRVGVWCGPLFSILRHLVC